MEETEEYAKGWNDSINPDSRRDCPDCKQEMIRVGIWSICVKCVGVRKLLK